MKSREAWLTLLTTVLGVDASACHQENPQSSPMGSVEISAVPAPSVAAAAPSAAPAASAQPDAADPFDAALAAVPDASKRAAAPPKDAGVDMSSLLNTLDPSSQGLCGVSNAPRFLNASCGGTAMPPGGTGMGLVGSSPDASVIRSDAQLTILSGETTGDARVVAGMRPGVKACFVQTLKQDPTTPDGSVSLTVAIAPNGEVTSVTPSTTNLPAADVSCVRRRVTNAQFDAQGGSGRTMVLSVAQKKL